MRRGAIANAVSVGAMLVLGWFFGCQPGDGRSGSGPEPAARASGASSTLGPSSGAPASAPSSPEPAGDMLRLLERELMQLEPCGELSCATFADAVSALRPLLDARPRILAVGEAHALLGAQVPSASERFERELLPELAKRGTSELVVELLKPAPECEKPVAAVAKQEKQVTEKQAEGSKNRFVSLGVAAKALSITPYLLEPDCEVYRSIAEAGDDAVVRMLEVIKSETERRVMRFHARQEERRARGEVPLLVVAYGGAMHNDLEAPKDKAAFVFGSKLNDVAGGRYLELDLIVPEFIQDTPVWRALPWYAAFDAKHPRSEATLIRVGPRSFVLVFPHGPTAPGSASPKAP